MALRNSLLCLLALLTLYFTVQVELVFLQDSQRTRGPRNCGMGAAIVIEGM